MGKQGLQVSARTPPDLKWLSGFCRRQNSHLGMFLLEQFGIPLVGCPLQFPSAAIKKVGPKSCPIQHHLNLSKGAGIEDFSNHLVNGLHFSFLILVFRLCGLRSCWQCIGTQRELPRLNRIQLANTKCPSRWAKSKIPPLRRPLLC